MAENHFTRGTNKIVSLDFTGNPHGIGIEDVTALEFTVRQQRPISLPLLSRCELLQ